MGLKFNLELNKMLMDAGIVEGARLPATAQEARETIIKAVGLVIEPKRLELLNAMAPMDHEPMCGSDQGEDMDECDCWKSVMTNEINRLFGE